MNIFALNGHKVKCETFDAGYDHEKELAKKYLEIGKEYTVEKTVVYDWHTKVYLKEFPDVCFNSVFFEDVDLQSEEKDEQHPDFLRYTM